MPAVVCENISCGSPPYLLNPVPPNEKPSCLNQYPVRVVSLDASFLAVYTATQFLRRTIPLCGQMRSHNGTNGLISFRSLDGQIMCDLGSVQAANLRG